MIKKNFLYFIKNIVCNEYVFFCITLLFLLNSCYLSFSPTLNKFVLNFNLYFPYFIIIIYFLNFKYSKFSLLFFIYCFILNISCIFGETTTIDNFLYVYIPIIGLSLYLEIALRYNCEKIIKSFSIAMFLLVFINFLTIIFWPEGLYYNGFYYNNWFLTYDNAHIFIYLPTIVLLYISLFYKKNHLFYYFLYSFNLFMVVFSVFYCFSANSVISFAMLLIYMFFEKKLTKLKILNVYTYLIIYLLVFIFIVIFRFQFLFSWLIVDIFHKSLTLSNRTILWDLVIAKIKEAPILGYGLETGRVFAEKFGNKNFSHAHNTILDILYKGGSLLLIAFFAMIGVVLNKLNKNKHFISKFISFVLFTMLFMMNFESRQEKIGLYIILVLSYNIDYIVNSFSKN